MLYRIKALAPKILSSNLRQILFSQSKFSKLELLKYSFYNSVFFKDIFLFCSLKCSWCYHQPFESIKLIIMSTSSCGIYRKKNSSKQIKWAYWSWQHSLFFMFDCLKGSATDIESTCIPYIGASWFSWCRVQDGERP